MKFLQKAATFFIVLFLAFFSIKTYNGMNPKIPGVFFAPDETNEIVNIEFDNFSKIFPSGCDHTIIKTKDNKYIKVKVSYQIVNRAYIEARIFAELDYLEI